MHDINGLRCLWWFVCDACVCSQHYCSSGNSFSITIFSNVQVRRNKQKVFILYFYSFRCSICSFQRRKPNRKKRRIICTESVTNSITQLIAKGAIVNHRYISFIFEVNVKRFFIFFLFRNFHFRFVASQRISMFDVERETILTCHHTFINMIFIYLWFIRIEEMTNRFIYLAEWTETVLGKMKIHTHTRTRIRLG